MHIAHGYKCACFFLFFLYIQSATWTYSSYCFNIRLKILYLKACDRLEINVAFGFFPPQLFFLSSAKVSSFESATTFVRFEKYESWVFGQLDTRLIIDQSTELKKFVGQCVLLCLSYLLMYISEQKNKKIKEKQLKAWICWIKHLPKTKQHWDIEFFFFI